jgi:hypothetical protein
MASDEAGAPDADVARVLDAVLALQPVPGETFRGGWPEARRFLARPHWIADLEAVVPRGAAVTARQCERVVMLVPPSMDADTLADVSPSAAILLEWVRAVAALEGGHEAEQPTVSVMEDNAGCNVTVEPVVAPAASGIDTRRMQLELELSQAMEATLPALASAAEVAQGLTKGQVAELKGFSKPPGRVAMVLEAVCALLQRPTTWKDAQKLLGEKDFLDRVRQLDPTALSPAVLKKASDYTMQPEFEPTMVKIQSAAAAALCGWVIHVVAHAQAHRALAPKRRALAELDAPPLQLSAASTGTPMELAPRYESDHSIASQVQTAGVSQAKLDQPRSQVPMVQTSVPNAHISMTAVPTADGRPVEPTQAEPSQVPQVPQLQVAKAEVAKVEVSKSNVTLTRSALTALHQGERPDPIVQRVLDAVLALHPVPGITASLGYAWKTTTP